MKTRLLIAFLFSTTIAAVLLYPAERTVAALPGHQPELAPPSNNATPTQAILTNQSKPQIEVVFVLDTTGSMSGLIQAAKENIWSIASNMASAQPTPDLKMGLVAYRDRGDAYVTKVTDLSSDLDSMYSTLMDYKADGGGDGPESVNQAVYDAINKITWNPDKNCYKVVFLVGDAPAHKDYSNDVQIPASLKIAAQKGIVVNTVLVGQDQTTKQEWQKIAGLNQGQFFQVEQAGGAVAIETPLDEKIAALSKDLDATRLFYGDAVAKAKQARKAAATDKLTASSSLAALAKRADFNASAAGAKNLEGEADLISDLAAGKIKLEAVNKADLPGALQALPAPAQAQLVEETSKKREVLKSQIAELSKQRQDYIKAKLGESNSEANSLDYKIFNAVKEQAKSKGISYQAAPKY